MTNPNAPSPPASRLRAFWPVLVGLALAGGVIGGVLAAAFTPKTYRATIGLRVKLNLGGIATNSSYDASGDSIRLMEMPLLRLTRRQLHGPARADPGALFRVSCTRNRSDTVAWCSTTSTNGRAAAASLRQLVRTFIPLNIDSQIGEFEALLRNLKNQYGELGRSDRRLTTAAQHGRRGAQARRELRVNEDVRRQILVHEASVRRQIRDVQGTLQVAGSPRVVEQSRTSILALWALVGLALGAVLAGAFMGWRTRPPGVRTRMEAVAAR